MAPAAGTGIRIAMTSSESPGSLPHACATPSADRDLLTSCVHCGLCLEVCPTYLLSGDENNSPRGRLRLWREESEGRLAPDPWTAQYTGECVGCLACETACPANVPYGEILEQTRHMHVAAGRTHTSLKLRIAAALAARPRLFNLMMLPTRLLRRCGVLPHRFLFSGRPAIAQSTAGYAKQLMAQHRPTGPREGLIVPAGNPYRGLRPADVEVTVATYDRDLSGRLTLGPWRTLRAAPDAASELPAGSHLLQVAALPFATARSGFACVRRQDSRRSYRESAFRRVTRTTTPRSRIGVVDVDAAPAQSRWRRSRAGDRARARAHA